MSVLVVGGGITGLTAAYSLGRAGIPTVLVESAPRLGGKVGTERLDGFLVETGPDSFISYRPAALDLVRELGLGEAIIRPTEPRTVQIRTGGRFRRLPDGMGLVLPTRMRPFVTTDLFSLSDKLRMGLDLVLPRTDLDRDIAVGTFLRRRLGGALVERLAGPLIGGVYGTPVDELSLLAVVPQLRDAEREHRSLLLASLASGRARKGQPAGSPFVTLAGGTSQLTDALVEAIARLPEVTVRTATPLRALARAGAAGYDARLGDGPDTRFDGVILATPGPAAADLLADVAPAAATQIRTIPHGSTAVVTLAYPLDRFADAPPGHGFLVAAGEPLAIDACTISSRKWAGRAPDDTILLRCFVGSRRPEALAGSDETVMAAVERDIATTLGVRGEPILRRIVRATNLMPHYTVGHLERVAAAFEALADLPGLVVAGAPYRGVGLPDCIAQGRAAAAALASLIGDGPSTSARNETLGVDRDGPASRLDQVAVGLGGRVVSVEPAHRADLAHEGVRTGVHLSVSSAAPFGGPLVLRVGGARIALARSVAATVEVAIEERGHEAAR
jgi:oxygen-dependent protoporphyrinogen oxidase